MVDVRGVKIGEVPLQIAVYHLPESLLVNRLLLAVLHWQVHPGKNGRHTARAACLLVNLNTNLVKLLTWGNTT